MALRMVGLRFTETMLYEYLLLGKGGLRRLRKNPKGVSFGTIEWGKFLKTRLQTKDNKINLVPEEFMAEAIEELKNHRYQLRSIHFF